jgi:hypothetical protein
LQSGPVDLFDQLENVNLILDVSGILDDDMWHGPPFSNESCNGTPHFLPVRQSFGSAAFYTILLAQKCQPISDGCGMR